MASTLRRDRLSAAARSYVMSRVRSKNTKPELIVRRHLHEAGLRFRLHRPDLPGKPDLVLPQYRCAVLVHGCFWHQHAQCDRARPPLSNAAYWGPKLKRNLERDRQARRELAALGWKVFVIWECQLSEKALRRLSTAIVRSGAKRKPSPRASKSRRGRGAA